MHYPHILLDLDNTLLDFGAAEEFSFFHTAKVYGLSLGREELALYQQINSALWADLELGRTTKPKLVLERFETLFDRLGIPGMDIAAYNAAYLDNLALHTVTYPGAEELCRQLKAAGCTLIVATNGVSATQHRRIQASGLAGYFDQVVVSDHVGAEKPSPRYFQYALHTCGISSPEGCLMVGDSLTADIGGGNAYGLSTCWFNPKGLVPRADSPIPTYTISKLLELLPIALGDAPRL